MAKNEQATFFAGPTVRRRLLLLAVALLALYVIVPRLGDLSSSLQAMRSAKPGYVALALLAMGGTYFCAATTYMLLAKHRLPWGRSLAVQVSRSFVNRLLPAGIGGMGLNAQYLRTCKHSLREALVVVGANNSLGVIGNNLLLLGTLAVGGASWSAIHLSVPSIPWYVGLLALVVLFLNLLLFPHLRRVLANGVTGVAQGLADYRHHPWRLAAALTTSLGVTLLHVLVLWCAGQAIGLRLPFPTYIIVFSAGALVAEAVPTPGGLGGFEAGLTAGLVAYGINPGHALAVALLFRLVNYWLPLVPGAIVSLLIRRRLKL